MQLFTHPDSWFLIYMTSHVSYSYFDSPVGQFEDVAAFVGNRCSERGNY